MALLEVENLEVNYGMIKALKGISFSVEKGEIIEYGSHDELMKLDGKYAYMFRLQAEKYTEDTE